MTAAERDEKFLDCAGRVLGGAGAKCLLELLIGARGLPDVAELARASVPARGEMRATAGASSPVMAK